MPVSLFASFALVLALGTGGAVAEAEPVPPTAPMLLSQPVVAAPTQVASPLPPAVTITIPEAAKTATVEAVPISSAPAGAAPAIAESPSLREQDQEAELNGRFEESEGVSLAAKAQVRVVDIPLVSQLIEDDLAWIDEEREFDFAVKPRKQPKPPAVVVRPVAPAAAKIARRPVKPKAPQRRLSHAKELLGGHYGQSVVQNGEQVADITGQVRKWTRNSVKLAGLKDWKRKSKLISDAILAESLKHEFDPVFIMAVIESESSFKPDTRGTAGEIGLMQILPSTAKWICELNGWKWTGKKMLLNPVQNIRIGAAFLSLLRKQFDSHSRLYLAAYNMGSTNVQRALANQVWPKDYAKRVMERYVAYYRELKKRSG